ncbi:MAG: hypothetical protein IJX67_02105 [Oscillospiraceae bacterium]|nr:hypothetical protein [Oscillospiraceae bacterium]
MKIKKVACLLMAFAMVWATASCRVNDGSVTELSDPPGPQQTTPADPGSSGPSKPELVPSDPDVTEPDVSEPMPSDPVDPSDPEDPTGPSEPDDSIVPSEPGHEHNYLVVIHRATCTEDGYSEYECVECGDYYTSDKYPATGHQWTEWEVTKEPTETATGMAMRDCLSCEVQGFLVLDKIIPDHTHSYTSKVTTAATCTKEGVKTFTCSCGGSYTESIPKVSHKYSQTVTKPTCTDKGYTTNKCSVCGDSYKDTYVAATGHSYGNYKSNDDATCMKDGTKTGSCSACGAKNTVTDTGSALGHSYKATVTAPTCTDKGYTTNKCSSCGDSYKDSYVKATGHKYGSYTSNGDATCTKDGTKTAICANGCGTKDTVTDVGSMVDHDYKVIKTVESFITGPGFQRYECSFCKSTYTVDLPEWTEEERNQFLRDVEAAVVKYVNQFRVEEGSTVATVLPGLTKVAQYRAVQLQKNFSHDTDDTREAFGYYKYGEYIDLTPYGYPDQYYSANAREAIATRSAGQNRTADALGYALANQIRTSLDHWSYVGSADYPFIAVGVEHGYGRQFTMCILQTRTDEYE